RDAGRIGEHVPGVGEQCEGARDDRADDLDADDGESDDEHPDELLAVLPGRARSPVESVRMAVSAGRIVVVPGRRRVPGAEPRLAPLLIRRARLVILHVSHATPEPGTLTDEGVGLGMRIRELAGP